MGNESIATVPKAKILVVEDEAIVALSIKEALQRMGYDVVAIAASGESAIEQAAATQPDLVLMDIRLVGELDGVAAAERIRADADIPIVFLTAYADEQLWQRARGTEPHGYLIKPFQRRELQTTIDIALRQHQATAQLRQALAFERKCKLSRSFEERCRESIWEGFPGGILLLNTDRALVLANPAGQKYLEGLSDRPLGSHPMTELGDRSLDELLSLTPEEERISEISPPGAAEPTFEVMVRSMTLDGNVEGWLICLWEVTRRKQLENQLKRSFEEERELSQLRADSIASVSHEYRTPLTTILSSAEFLEHYSDRLSTERKLNHLNRIKTAVKRMTQLLDDVLILNKAEAGKLNLQPSTLDLEQFCRELIEEMQETAGNHYTLSFICECEDTQAYLDTHLLLQILGNLLSNAIKYSPEGGIVKLKLTCENDTAVFQITDEGIGISAEDRTRLFQPFQRASNTGTIPGTGLGLSIVKKAVELQKGEITVDSAIGVGTSFTVTVPISLAGVKLSANDRG